MYFTCKTFASDMTFNESQEFRTIPNSMIRSRPYLSSMNSIKKIGLERPLKMGPIGCLETSVTNYHSTLLF